ncbi:gluconokinase [Maribacter aestuarii]|uniref:gluconokinase n=1 Tax=Maribacter aestuarii TaxID=1130723 RepID=UPI00248C13E1|nr:gluconokinase [Maribacter aestuarii]
MNNDVIIFVMGVSGSGKSTIGKLLAERLDYPFFDGDDFHPKANIEKMAQGKPLNDTDRKSWLERLNRLSIEHKNKGAVIACSALKESYRQTLSKHLNENCRFVYLEGSMDEINQRLAQRTDHFMPPALLKSQFETLEVPKNAIRVSINNSPEKIVNTVVKVLET